MEENKEIVLVFYVKGSGKKPYRVAFWKEKNSRDIHSGCGCPAGRRMQYCKHRFQLIEGDLTNLDDSTEDAKEKLEVLYNWIEDSDIGDFFEKFTMAKTGEKIQNLSNKVRFIYSKDKDVLENVEYKNSTQKKLYIFDPIELYLEKFLEFLENGYLIIESRNHYNVFNVNDELYCGSFKGNFDLSKNANRLKLNTYTCSKHLIEAFNYFNMINISEINQKMKEIMK